MVEVNTLVPVPSPRMTGKAPWLRLVREPGTEPLYNQSARRVIESPRDVRDLLAPRLEREEQEVFIMVALDARHRVIACSEVTRGTVDSALVSPRETFRLAIALGAAAIIVAHNHPSGDPSPSPNDLKITEQLVEAGALLDIPLQDSIVIGSEGRFISIRAAMS